MTDLTKTAEYLNTDAANTVAEIAANVGNGWGGDSDKAAELLRQASFLLARDAWTERVSRLLTELELPVGEKLYENDGRNRSLYWGEMTLDPGEFAFTYRAGRTSLDPHGFLHLTICAFDAEDRLAIINALIDAGDIVDGWGGDENEFAEAHSKYGWISVRTERQPHPSNA